VTPSVRSAATKPSGTVTVPVYGSSGTGVRAGVLVPPSGIAESHVADVPSGVCARGRNGLVPTVVGYLSTSPTTKNIDPRIATMSGTRHPGSTCESTWTLENDAERSLSRHGVFSPRDTRW
jgi:hypothetical protein